MPIVNAVTAVFSPKGGVGTTTLTIQLGEAMALQEGHQVLIIDLALPLGGLAPLLKLYTTRHVAGLLKLTADDLSLDSILRFAQSHRSNLKVIPAPGRYLAEGERPSPQNLATILGILADNGYHVLLDVGAHLTPLALAALKRADKTFVITSGQPEANLHLDTFLAGAEKMGLDQRRLMPVVNELHGPVKGIKLTRVPAARIPHTTERLRTRLWLTEQGLQKLVNVALSRTTPIA